MGTRPSIPAGMTENAKRTELAKMLGIEMDEMVMCCCLNILELGCSSENLAIIYAELDKELSKVGV